MKKAKEYAAQIIDSDYSQVTIAEVFHALIEEIAEVSKARNVKTDRAFKAIILEQQQKWTAICRIVNEKHSVLSENGFLNLLKRVIPETEQLLERS